MPQAWNTLFCTDPSNHYCWFCHQVPSNSCISWNDHCKDDPNSLAHHLGFKHGWWTTTLLRSNNCLPIPIRSKSQRNGSVSSDEVKGRELIYIYIYGDISLVYVTYDIILHPRKHHRLDGNQKLWKSKGETWKSQTTTQFWGSNMLVNGPNWGCIIKLKLTELT